MNFEKYSTRRIFCALLGALLLSCLWHPSPGKAGGVKGYIPEGSAVIFLFKADKNDPGVRALTGGALEKLSEGKVSRQIGQNILSLISGEVLGVVFPPDSDQSGDKLAYGIVAGYVRENFDFTVSLRGNTIRMKAKSIPDLENKVLSPLLEQALNSESKNFTREVFKGRQIVSLAQAKGDNQGITTYSFADGKIFLGSSPEVVKKLLLLQEQKASNSYPFYETFLEGKEDGLLFLDNTRGYLAGLIKNNKNLAEFGTILSMVNIHQATLSFNLVDENSLTGGLDIFPEGASRLNFLEKEVQLLGAFLKGRLFLEGLNWSNKVQKQGDHVRMEFQITNLKTYFE